MPSSAPVPANGASWRGGGGRAVWPRPRRRPAVGGLTARTPPAGSSPACRGRSARVRPIRTAMTGMGAGCPGHPVWPSVSTMMTSTRGRSSWAAWMPRAMSVPPPPARSHGVSSTDRRDRVHRSIHGQHCHLRVGHPQRGQDPVDLAEGLGQQPVVHAARGVHDDADPRDGSAQRGKDHRAGGRLAPRDAGVGVVGVAVGPPQAAAHSRVQDVAPVHDGVEDRRDPAAPVAGEVAAAGVRLELDGDRAADRLGGNGAQPSGIGQFR